MIEPPIEIKAPVAWFPAGLIGWYAAGGMPVFLVTSWIALVGGDRSRVRTAWHGRHDPASCFWPGGDFVLNVPCDGALDKVREVMRQGRLCLNAEVDLGYGCVSGIAAVAPRLLGCAIQIECVGGRLIDTGFDTELSGEVVRVHRDQVIIDPVDIPDLCAINPLCVSETS